jgi:hypothetical protein
MIRHFIRAFIHTETEDHRRAPFSFGGVGLGADVFSDLDFYCRIVACRVSTSAQSRSHPREEKVKGSIQVGVHPIRGSSN